MENSERLSLSAYWEKHLDGIMGEKRFRKEYNILMADKDFAKNFGKYFARKLSPKQIELLNKEFINQKTMDDRLIAAQKMIEYHIILLWIDFKKKHKCYEI